MTITATVVSQPITAAVSGGGTIAANVGSSTVSAAASGGIGPQGSAGVSNVPGPTGATGPAGPQGIQGVAGAVGAAGNPATATTDASALASGTLSDARLSANVVLTTDNRLLAFDRDRSTTRYDIFNRSFSSASVSFAANATVLSFFSVPTTITISGLVAACFTQSASEGKLARMGLYSFDGSTVTLLAQTTADATLFNTSGTLFTRSLSTEDGYPASLTLSPNVRYAFGVFSNRVMSLFGRSFNQLIAAQEPRLSATLEGGLSDLPASSSTFTPMNQQFYAALVIA